MLQHEFDELMGITSTTEEYTLANAIYMDVDMDKVNFCKEWKKMRNSPLLNEVSDKLNAQRKHLHSADEKVRKHGEKLAQLGNLHDDDELRTMAREMLGTANYVKLCLEKGYRLRSLDREYLISLIG